MRIHSDSFDHRGAIPPGFALGVRDGDAVGFGRNRNPQLGWDDVPAGTRSFALLCIDADAPTVAGMVGKDGVQIPVDQPRADFCHWAMVDIPADVRGIPAGSASDGVTAHGKRDPAGPAGARQGLNDYTGWFAGDDALAGDWFGYDGPFPPPNDLRPHRYFFRLFALDVERLDVPDRFTAADVQRAMHGHVLAEALVQGHYSLHPDRPAPVA
ncbi:phosphatidylethanolamine-binding protein [Lysobacter arseniciresistens ZS79]|uniref:Phosphatidylethanolamine-binding protein n=1 Tax=Lysobacter arseniciresistens ZS79 TaxID=913325 RepID=A0A0A0EUT3_9GAMM|nr:YbhB/YbcL family Raf kinase inhibitor-like protein [Lysobacter arseniciresistens]KGM54015.1 phosphatidylethanolamine-binding protein [Lysobacter arseniciresistens ZS79]